MLVQVVERCADIKAQGSRALAGTVGGVPHRLLLAHFRYPNHTFHHSCTNPCTVISYGIVGFGQRGDAERAESVAHVAVAPMVRRMAFGLLAWALGRPYWAP